MTRAQKIWDFIFGVTLISGAPIATLWAVSFGASVAFHPAAETLIIQLTVLASGVIAFVVACIWRRRHRKLPASFFVVELMAAIFAGGLFMLVFSAAGYAAYRAD